MGWSFLRHWDKIAHLILHNFWVSEHIKEVWAVQEWEPEIPGIAGTGTPDRVSKFGFECGTQNISHICPHNPPQIYLISPVREVLLKPCYTNSAACWHSAEEQNRGPFNLLIKIQDSISF